MMNPLFLELVRQVLRWGGVWLMTVGVPESIAGLTANEDAVFGAAGLLMYLVADTGWLAAKWRAWMGKGDPK
jgi:hypothetical protein